jgi:hypothetical protein
MRGTQGCGIYDRTVKIASILGAWLQNACVEEGKGGRGANPCPRAQSTATVPGSVPGLLRMHLSGNVERKRIKEGGKGGGQETFLWQRAEAHMDRNSCLVCQIHYRQ